MQPNHVPEDFDIDYMHPDGKPMPHELQPTTEDAKPDAKSLFYAHQEADGHSLRKFDPFIHPEDDDQRPTVDEES